MQESATELRKWEVTEGMFSHDFIDTPLFLEAYDNIFHGRDFDKAADFLEEVDHKLKHKHDPVQLDLDFGGSGGD